MILGKGQNLIVLAGFLLISVLSPAQQVKSYKYLFSTTSRQTKILHGNQSLIIDYSMPGITVTSITNENGSFYRISVPGHTCTTEPGKPELPVLSRLIDIPEGSAWKIRISDVKSEKVVPSTNNIRGLLLPSQYGETKQQDNKKPAFTMDRKLYSSRKLISSDTVRIESLGTVRNKHLSTLIISPVRYDPHENILEVITSMRIEINIYPGTASAEKVAQTESPLFSETMDKGVLNFYPYDLITGFSDKPVEMIIVTDTSFKKFLQPYYRWKTQKGYKLDILYFGEGLAGKDCNELKQSISNIYKSSSQSGYPPEYLLIVGDSKKVPYYSSGTDNITDMYYAEFDGNGDFMPDMYFGRIPATDTTSVKAYVQKIIQYEKFEFADTNKFYSRALAFAGKDASYGDYMNGQIKYEVTNYLTPGNKINEYHFYYPDGFTKKDSVMKLISRGLSFINYSGHGSSAGWLHIDIKSPDIKNFNNPDMYPFVISNACRTAQFNDTASLGNKMVLASRKGAIGFIGCSNDSYWDEDFYWAVGTGSPGPDPKYSATGLGAFDRLFHTHGELPSDWYISMGQVNFAGNLSVSSSSSARKKYYWETYNVLGDPSTIPYIGEPTAFNISVPDTLPNGIKSLSLTIDPFAYIAVSHFDTLWDASFAGPSGSVTLDMPGLSNDSCLIVVTGQNRIPLIKTVHFSKINKEFINLTESGINDSQGNSNNRADYGEDLFLKLRISNLGKTAAYNLVASISSESQWVTIKNNSVPIGTLPALSEITLDNDFGLKIDENVPDLGIITIDLKLKDNKTEKNYRIDLTVHAPVLKIINCMIDDATSGNNNSVADPGETFNLVFQVMNIGSSNTSGQLLIDSEENELEILDTDVKSGLLEFGKITNIPVTVKLSESAPFGDYISLASRLDCSPFVVNRDFIIRVGKIRESFESAKFNVFPWINISPKPWTITSGSSIDGSLSARSGAIGHNGSTVLMIRTFYPKDDSVKFWYRVSSEPNYDYFTFKLNNFEKVRKSGETGWAQLAFKVPAGLNVMQWTYKKDNSVSQGGDGAWIDLIDFSATAKVQYIQRDLEVARIITPVQKDVYGQEPVTVSILNLGRDTLDGFNLAYSVNGHIPVIQHFKTKLPPYSDSLRLTFEKRADMDMSGVYKISVFGFDNDDDYLLNDTLSISVENTEIEESVTIYPNPFDDQLSMTINSRSNIKVQVSLANLSGQRVFSREEILSEGENQITLNTQNLSPSMYILNIYGSSFSRSFPVVKLKP
ncbi:MAG: C25 family cysteine peptidase [Bacteroidota bacterium]|nr:C25 family cysteine peptidase [Bacteroidota bacterium]